MDNSYYLAEDVDAMLDKSASVIDAFAATIKEQQQEIEGLRKELDLAKSAAAGRVTLEKVAGLTNECATEFATFLADRAFIDHKDIEKYASAMREDANAMRMFATKAIESSLAPVSQGYGVKRASNDPKDAALAREEALWAAAGYRA